MTPPPSKTRREDETAKFRKCHLIPELKYQKAYLSPRDTNIVFDEANHIYKLRDTSQRFAKSVTGFCKSEVLHSDFDAVRIIRNQVFSPVNEIEFDMHVVRLLEWKYAAVFGSLFHAMVEYYFENMVNVCDHTECRITEDELRKFEETLCDETNNRNMDNGILTQVLEHDSKFRENPPMPCRYALQRFDEFTRMVLDGDNMKVFLENNPRYSMSTDLYSREIEKSMESAFERNRNTLKPSVQAYRKAVSDDYYMNAQHAISLHFNTSRVIADLEQHFIQFRRILLHLPLHACFDIRPEYIVHSVEHGLAGSVDLTMRMRDDPKHLLIYDWKTNKKIFSTFYRNNGDDGGSEPSNQLYDYGCQLHTYRNIIKEIDQSFKIDLYVVNVTSSDACIYNVKSPANCKCFYIFREYKLPLIG